MAQTTESVTLGDMEAPEFEKFQTYIRKNPVNFINDNFGSDHWDRPKEIIEAVFGVGKYAKSDKDMTSVRSCTASSKTFVAAEIIWSFLISHTNAMVLTTAPTWPQVEENIWKEIHRAFHASKLPLDHYEPNQTEYEIIKGWGIWGFSTKNYRNTLGRHAPHVLIVLDDAPGVPKEITDAIENTMSGAGHKHLLMLGNPDSTSGAFHASHHQHRHLYNTIHIDAFDTPNFKGKGNVRPYLITPEWAEKVKKKWGEKSILFQCMVRGNFPLQSEDSLIPLAWVEAANKRWLEVQGKKKPSEFGRPSVGADPARYGKDDIVITPMYGGVYAERQISKNGQDTVWTAARAIEVGDKMDNPVYGIDGVGVGGGVVDNIRKDRKDAQVIDIQGGESPTDKDNFKILRDEIWCDVRDGLNPEGGHDLMLLPPDDELTADLTAIKFKFIGRRVVVESKEELKKPTRLGRSTDRGDSLGYAKWAHRMGAGLKLGKPSNATPEPEKPSGMSTPRGRSDFLGGFDL